jgi:hypothetical protein
MKAGATVVEQDLNAWLAGYLAGKSGRDPTAPYPAGTTAAWSWQSGYIEGRREERKDRD